MKKRLVTLLMSLLILGTLQDPPQAQEGDTETLPVRQFDPDKRSRVAISLAREDYSKSSPRLLVDDPSFGPQSANIKFHGEGNLGQSPLERLKGIPQDIKTLYYGLFCIGAPGKEMRRAKNPQPGRGVLSQEYVRGQYPDYDWNLRIDDQVSFLIGQREKDVFVVCIDANNNEDLSDDEILPFQTVYWGTKGNVPYSRLGGKPPVGEHFRFLFAETKVGYEYQDSGILRSAQVPIGIYYSINPGDRQLPFSRPRDIRGEIQERRRGRVRLGDEVIDFVLIPDKLGSIGTYHIASSSIIWDLNNNGIFELEKRRAEIYETEESFSINGVSLQIDSVSTYGDRLILKESDQVVPPRHPVGEGLLAPDFEAALLDGRQISLESLRGKTIVLNFWSTTCGPCIMETPGLNRLAEEFIEDDVVFLAPADDDEERLKAFLERKPFKYQIIPNASKIHDLYHVSGLPTHVIVNRKGLIEIYITGGAPIIDEFLRPVIAKTLEP